MCVCVCVCAVTTETLLLLLPPTPPTPPLSFQWLLLHFTLKWAQKLNMEKKKEKKCTQLDCVSSFEEKNSTEGKNKKMKHPHPLQSTPLGEKPNARLKPECL